MKWPHFYPANCPPRGAKPASGKMYRLVQHNPAQAEDFTTPFEENPKRFNNRANVRNCGLSVHKDPQDSERLKRSVRIFKDRQVAEGNLTPKFGKIEHTPSSEFKSHYTWWMPVGIEPWTIFKP